MWAGFTDDRNRAHREKGVSSTLVTHRIEPYDAVIGGNRDALALAELRTTATVSVVRAA
jgi:hypothetical protein